MPLNYSLPKLMPIDTTPVGYAVLENGKVIFLHVRKEEADAWLHRNIPGREVQPVFLNRLTQAN